MTLSGGIDSALIYTLIKERLRRKIRAYTYIHSDEKTNEYAKVAKLVREYSEDVICIRSNMKKVQ